MRFSLLPSTSFLAAAETVLCDLPELVPTYSNLFFLSLAAPTPKAGAAAAPGGSLSPRAPASPMRRARGGIGVGTVAPASLPMNLAIGAAHAHQFDEDEEDDNAVINEGSVLPDLQIWVMVLQKTDKRPAWRKQYDDGMVPWQDEFTESEGKPQRAPDLVARTQTN